MVAPILATKLHIPVLRSNLVSRPHLVQRLDEGMEFGQRLTLISAPAGFGKTTLASEWVARCGRAVAWLSLEEEDGEPGRFLAHFVAALQTVAPGVGKGLLIALGSAPGAPPAPLLTGLVNEIAMLPEPIVLVLDDYHVIDAREVDEMLAFLLEHLPPQLHLALTTREDPQLPLARLRARGQMTEVRVDDLRFSVGEATAFLNSVMGLELTAEQVAALEQRTEGWIAGLQLAALSMRGHNDPAAFVDSFTGSHRYVLDYLVEEVLEQQPPGVQTFLLQTSILERLSGPLCEAVMGGRVEGWGDVKDHVSGHEMLARLERANLFVTALDNERRWYRYHHLFADLLRKRLEETAEHDVAALHRRASEWYEGEGLALEAFRHAVAAKDVARAARLVEGEGMPLHYQGAVAPVAAWLASLPAPVMDARPALWVTYASAMVMGGRPVSDIEAKLLAAEAALAEGPDGAVQPLDEKRRDLVGQIAGIRAMLAVPQNEVETVIAQAHRALAHLHPDNAPARTAAAWALSHAYQLQGDLAAARQAFLEVMSSSQATGNVIFEIAAMTGLGQLREAKNELLLAEKRYRRVLGLAGDPPLPVACAAHLGLAQIFYERNDLDAAERHGQLSLQLGRLLVNTDAPGSAKVLLARLRTARGDVNGAAAVLADAEQFVRANKFMHRVAEIAAAQVRVLLQQGQLAAAAELAEKHDLPISRARVSLAQGEPDAALAVLKPVRREAEASGRLDQVLQVLVLEALALQAQGEREKALWTLGEALALAEPEGFLRTFVDEGAPMATLLGELARGGSATDYLRRLQEAIGEARGIGAVAQPLVEPLTERELDVLRLLRSDLNGPAIARELMISLNTMRTHTKNIYTKLGVNSRRTALRRAEKLGLF